MDVKILCLGVLSRGECSGYEIRKQFEDGPFSHFQEAGFGSIYPALKKLTEGGLVTCREHSQDSRPDKKVYAIAAKGRQSLFDAVNGEPGADKLRSDFMFMLFFGDLIAPADIDDLIAKRIANHSATLARLESCGAVMPPSERFVLKFGVAMHRAALRYLEDHRHELIGALLQKDVAE